MKLKLTTDKPAPVMAVILNHEKRESEVLDANHFQVADFRFNSEAKIIQVAVVFGGYDSSGKWHTDPRQEAATISISGQRPEQLANYNLLALDESGNPHFCFDDAWFRRLFVEAGMLELLNSRVWAHEEVEVHIDSESVFKKEKPKVETKD